MIILPHFHSLLSLIQVHFKDHYHCHHQSNQVGYSYPKVISNFQMKVIDMNYVYPVNQNRLFCLIKHQDFA